MQVREGGQGGGDMGIRGAGDGDKGVGGRGKGGPGTGEERVGDWGRGGKGREILGAGVIPKFVVFYQFYSILCTSMQ